MHIRMHIIRTAVFELWILVILIPITQPHIQVVRAALIPLLAYNLLHSFRSVFFD